MSNGDKMLNDYYQVEIDALIGKAIRCYELSQVNYGNQATNEYYDEKSSSFYDKAEKIAQKYCKNFGYSVKFDYPGLYPTYEIVRLSDNKRYTEYNAEGFLKRVRGFWD